MKLNQFFSGFEGMKITETRCMHEEYVEIVFLNQDLTEWYKLLSAKLGEPRKGPGVEPTGSDLEVSRSTGGIWVNQTLFEKSFGDATVIAKFWPWSDGVHTTLKMALLIHRD